MTLIQWRNSQNFNLILYLISSFDKNKLFITLLSFSLTPKCTIPVLYFNVYGSTERE